MKSPRNTLKNVDARRYAELLAGVKARVHEARVRAGLAANQELIRLYWDVGRLIVQRQSAEGWGAAVTERLSRNLLREFPGVKGFSPRNIWRMRTFYLAYCESNTNLPQPVAEVGELEWCEARIPGPMGRPHRSPGQAQRRPGKADRHKKEP